MSLWCVQCVCIGELLMSGGFDIALDDISVAIAL